MTPAKLRLFTPATERFVIGTLDSDGKRVEIVAQYNPKELALQAQATWEATNANGRRRPDRAKRCPGTAPRRRR